MLSDHHTYGDHWATDQRLGRMRLPERLPESQSRPYHLI